MAKDHTRSDSDHYITMQVFDRIVYVYLVNTLLQQHKALRQVASILKISNLKSHYVILPKNQARG